MMINCIANRRDNLFWVIHIKRPIVWCLLAICCFCPDLRACLELWPSNCHFTFKQSTHEERKEPKNKRQGLVFFPVNVSGTRPHVKHWPDLVCFVKMMIMFWNTTMVFDMKAKLEKQTGMRIPAPNTPTQTQTQQQQDHTAGLKLITTEILTAVRD